MPICFVVTIFLGKVARIKFDGETELVVYHQIINTIKITGFDISRVKLEPEYLAEFKTELFTDEVHLVNTFTSGKPKDTWKLSSVEYIQIHSVLLYSQQHYFDTSRILLLY